MADWHHTLLETCRSDLGGFDLAGIVDVQTELDDPDSFFNQSTKRYRSWIANGYQGEMNYLVRGLDRRLDPRLVFPEVQSILCVGLRYSSQPLGNEDSTKGPRYARYLRGGDYHQVIAEKLEKVLGSLHTNNLKWKVCVDTSAVLERTWGYLCGLGWIGKNSMLIHPQLGSYFLIGVVLLNQKTGCTPQPLSNYCGSCSRCLKGCPTGALIEPGVLDSRKCTSYLTLEKRGDFSSEKQTLQQMGTWVAGCDICQEVCPFNQKVSRQDPPAIQDFLNDWPTLLSENSEEYRSRIQHTAMSRIKPADFKRNLVQAFENSKALKT